MGKNNSRLNGKNLELAKQAKFFTYFRKKGFWETLYQLSLDEISRDDFYTYFKDKDILNDYYSVEPYLLANKLIKLTIDPKGTEIMIALTEKGMLVRKKIDAINQFLNEK